MLARRTITQPSLDCWGAGGGGLPHDMHRRGCTMGRCVATPRAGPAADADTANAGFAVAVAAAAATLGHWAKRKTHNLQTLHVAVASVAVRLEGRRGCQLCA